MIRMSDVASRGGLAHGEHDSRADETVLAVEDLHVRFDVGRQTVKAVDGVSFAIRRGEIFGIVGESGCGKSATLRALIGLLPPTGVHTSGRVSYEGRNLLELGERALRRVRGAEISMVFQDPMTFLNPVLRVGEQIEEALRQHTPLARVERRARAVELMHLVGIALPERRLREYPHQFSGGMRQRVLLAIALACGPKVLLADEPTTALDVTIQSQILRLLKRIRDELGMSIVLVSHDLGVIAQMCERVAVMYAGQVVESAPVRELIRNPRHPYTVGLLSSLPRLDTDSRYLVPIPGAPPTLTELKPGCRFADRCPLVLDDCREWQTELLEASPGHRSRCLRHEIAGGVNA
jgi:oligopeptide/dipeptide ABC transporter ATP-binding protein